MQKGKTSTNILFTIILLISLNESISDSTQIIKLKMNIAGPVKIISNPSLMPSKIYVNDEYKNSNVDTITTNNINDVIKLEWSYKLITCNSMFASLNRITEINFTNIDSSDVTDMQLMFYQCTSLKSINFDNFNTAKVTNMTNMFTNCTSLISLDVSGFNTGKVTLMIKMFYACYSLKELDLSKFDTSLVQSFNAIFMDCYNLKFINLKGIKTYIAVDFSSMFYNCLSLKSLDLSSFETSKVIGTRYMFYNCVSLTSLDLSNFDTSSMYFMNNMFAECKNLGYLNFKNLEKPYLTFTSGDWILNNILDNTPQNMVIYFSKSSASEFNDIFSGKSCMLIDSSGNWESKQKKINAETGVCMDSCNGNFKFYYQYKCYRACPEGTEEKEISSFKCEDIIIEEPNWIRLEKETSKVINEQVKSQTTEIKEDNNNIDTYNNLNTIKSTYLINVEEGTNKHTDFSHQTEQSTNIKNEEKTILIENEILTSINNVYINICNITSFLNNECNLNTQSNKQNHDFVFDIISKIEDGSLDFLITSVINENKNIIIENEDEIYSISSIENQNFNETRTIIELGNCEQELRKVYNLTEDENIIIFKIEKNIPGFKIPIMGYELFSRNGKINLNMEYCQNTKANIHISVNIDENELYKYEPKNEYYNDRCNQYTTENGTDITIYDRKKEYNDNNMSLCEKNCEFQGYDINNKVVKCECGVKNIKNLFNNKNQLLSEFKNIKKIMNIDIIICYKSLLKLKGLIYNIGSYTIFALFFFSIICSIVFCAKGYNSFIKNIKSLIKKKLSLKKRTKEKKFKSNKNKMKNKSRFSPNHFPDNNNINNNNILTINNVNINVNMKKTNSKKKKNKKMIKRKPTFNDYELNSFEYDEVKL